MDQVLDHERGSIKLARQLARWAKSARYVFMVVIITFADDKVRQGIEEHVIINEDDYEFAIAPMDG
jgi:hypothetical protein